MLFDNIKLAARKTAALRAPPVPDTGWHAPSYYPDLAGALCIGFDVETYDPELDDYGPGWARGPVGYVCGISIAALMPDGRRGKWYFPVAHIVESDSNLDGAHTWAWLRETLATPRIDKVCANGSYDIGWLAEYGVDVQGPLYDVQVAEALLHESGEVNLDYLGLKYLGVGKTTSLLYEWAAQAYGGPVSGKQRANIYRSPPRLVGPYAEDDADMPISVFQAQLPLLQEQGLWKLFRVECDLIPMLVKMRQRGCAVDIPYAEALHAELGSTLVALNAELKAKLGFECNVNEADSLARAFDSVGIKYSRTATGLPSFKKDFLTNLHHPLSDAINTIREHEKLRGTFLQSYILDGHCNGRIHCSFNALRADDGGTRTGRFSSSDPNLQNIPVRSELGSRVRQAFIPHAGCFQWRKYDYSQIEYRFHVHYAVGKGADDVRARYNSDPSTDYHKLTQLLVKEQTGKLIERKPIKNINFGLLYGMGQGKLARQLGLNPIEAKELFAAYHAGNPYTKTTMDAIAAEAQALGYITTIMGRRRRFETWEPAKINFEHRAPDLPYDMALRQYGPNIKRAMTHKAINSRYQGSAADQMKMGMLGLWQSGVLDYIGVPSLTVHDELDWSQQDDSTVTREAFDFVTHTMEQVIQLRVPVKVDCKWGPNWGAID